MLLPKLLRLAAFLALLPGIAALFIAGFAGTPPSSAFGQWCQDYWWATLVLGALIFYPLRGLAWLMDRGR